MCVMHDYVSGEAEKEAILDINKRRPYGFCFPSTSTVNLNNGKTVIMSELQVGDKVQTGIKPGLKHKINVGDRVMQGYKICHMRNITT